MRKSFALIMVVSMGLFPGAPARAASWVQNWFDTATYTPAGSFSDETRGFVTAGGFSGRINVHDDYLMSMSLPKIKGGCGGIDMFLGGMSFLDPDYLVKKLESILQAAPAVAFQYVLETLDEKMGNIISKMEAATNYLNAIQVNDCRLANRLVAMAKDHDGNVMSGILEEATGEKSIEAGFAKHYQQVREKISANNNNPTDDLKELVSNCPAEVKDVFKSGSLLRNAATRIGAGDWADIMRGRVGDVYMRWDDGDKVPVFAAVPPCPKQDLHSAEDLVQGTLLKRPFGVAPIPACVQDGAVTALSLARDRLQSISDKLTGNMALSDEEKNFIVNIKTMPLYQLLSFGVRTSTQGTVINDIDELVAISMSYQMLNDLLRAVEYAIDSVDRSAGAANAADPGVKSPCNMQILKDGIDALQKIKTDILVQRGETKKAYMASLEQAHLAASYANLANLRSNDARAAASNAGASTK